jgi:glycosyltransferase involved in cell wall biosynthesis
MSIKKSLDIWLVNPFDRLPMEQKLPGRYGYLCEVLLNRGHSITWWTSTFCHFTKKLREITPSNNSNLNIVYLKSLNYEKNIGFKRLINSYQYGQAFKREALKCAPPDLIFASYPPIDSALTVTQVGKKLTVPTVLDVQDIWPDVFLFPFPDRLKKVAKLGLLPFFLRAKKSFNEATAISAVSNEYLNYGLRFCETKTKPQNVTYLGYDENSFNLAEMEVTDRKKKDRSESWILFAGTLGHTYDILTIIEAAKRLRDRKDLKFKIIGDGPLFEKAKDLVNSYNLTNLELLGRVNFDVVVKYLKSSTVGLNAYSSGAPQSFTNKICEYLGSGLPVVNSVGGELSQLISTQNLGLSYQAGDSADLAIKIETLLNCDLEDISNRASEFAKKSFERSKTYESFANFLEELASENLKQYLF